MTCRFALILAFISLGLAPAYAANEKPVEKSQEEVTTLEGVAGEIVYRTNLGRAADVNMLIHKKQASADQVNEEGTPLVALAANRTDSEGINVLKALVEAGADINATDAKGQNALFYAARQGNKDAVAYLLDKGIKYYSPDKEGNIARTIAYQTGHLDILDLMDQFVSAQSEKVNEQYREYNRQIEERNKLIEEQNKAAAEAQQKIIEEAAKKQAEAEEAARIAAEKGVTPDSAQEVEKKEAGDYLGTLAPADSRSVQEKRESPDFDTDMRSLSFSSCAFQYWSYCRQIKQRSDLSLDEMRVAIDTHKQQVTESIKHNMQEYQLEKSYLDPIVENAKQRIYNQLDEMPSKTYRFQNGVCMMPDLQTRCTEIAETWNLPPAARTQSRDSKQTAPAGGIGGVGSRSKSRH